jgi:hypothetical protein
MKTEDQFKLIKSRQQVQYHRMFNTLATHIQKNLEMAVPGLRVQLGGKTVQGNLITATLTGTAPDEENIDEKVRMAVDALKDTNLL